MDLWFGLDIWLGLPSYGALVWAGCVARFAQLWSSGLGWMCGEGCPAKELWFGLDVGCGCPARDLWFGLNVWLGLPSYGALVWAGCLASNAQLGRSGLDWMSGKRCPTRDLWFGLDVWRAMLKLQALIKISMQRYCLGHFYNPDL